MVGETDKKRVVDNFDWFSPIIYFCQNVVELVIAWNGKSMGKKKFELGKDPFLKNVF